MKQIEVINLETIIDVTAETSNVEILVQDYDSELSERFALEAQEAAIDADESADIATAQASIATAQAGIATTQAGIATTQAGIATTQSGIATTKANEASASAASALASEQSADADRILAQNAATTATTQAGIATTQAGIATTKAVEASDSAASALASETDAETAASTATTQAGIATTQAGIATTQASNALTSANNAAASAASAASAALNTPLTGFTTGANSTILATDTTLQAFGKAQGQINARVSGTGASGQVAFWNGTSSQTGDNGLFWDNTNKRLGIGTNTPNAPFQITGSTTAASAIARGANLTSTLVAAANNDVLVGLDVNPTFTNGAFTGVTNIPIRVGTSSTTAFGSPLIFMGRDQNAESNFQISNSTDGSSAAVGFRIFGANLRSATIQEFSQSHSTTEFASHFVIESNNPNAKHGIILSLPSSTAGSDLMVYTAGRLAANRRLTLFNSTGNLLLQSGGTHSDAGFRLDVNGTARVQGATTITRGAGETALTASFGGANSSIVLQSHSTSDFSRIQIGTAFALSREGGGVSNINSTASALRLTSNITEFNGTNVLIRINGANTSFSGWNSAASTITLGNGFNTYEFIQQTRARHLVWHQTDTSTNPTIFASSLFSLSSTTRGFLPPRMTTTQKDAIASPETGLVVYDTTLNKLAVYTGAAWETVTSL